MSNNHYYETLDGIEGELTEDKIVGRISECNTILNELTNSVCWNVVLRDVSEQVKIIDGCWHDLPDGDVKLKEMRILKMSARHILDLPLRYARELDKLTEELQKRQQSQEVISKDFDNEI